MSAGPTKNVLLSDGRPVVVTPAKTASGVFCNGVFQIGWISTQEFIDRALIPIQRALDNPVAWVRDVQGEENGTNR